MELLCLVGMVRFVPVRLSDGFLGPGRVPVGVRGFRGLEWLIGGFPSGLALGCNHCGFPCVINLSVFVVVSGVVGSVLGKVLPPGVFW